MSDARQKAFLAVLAAFVIKLRVAPLSELLQRSNHSDSAGPLPRFFLMIDARQMSANAHAYMAFAAAVLAVLSHPLRRRKSKDVDAA